MSVFVAVIADATWMEELWDATLASPKSRILHDGGRSKVIEQGAILEQAMSRTILFFYREQATICNQEP
jgi:hypothetical protein